MINKCWIIFLSVLLLAACSNNPAKESAEAIQLELNADSTQIVLKGLDHNIMQSLQEDSLGREELEPIFSVYKQSKDEDLVGLEKSVPGTYKIASDRLIYTPDSGFVKNETYRAEFRMPEFYDQKDVIGKGMPGKVSVKAKEFEF